MTRLLLHGRRITTGSRLQLLARAELRTGRDLGYLEAFKAVAQVQRSIYEMSRAEHAVSHPLRSAKSVDIHGR